LREVLTDGVSLSPAPDMLFQLFSYLTGGDRRQKAKALAAGADPDGDGDTIDVLAALQKFPGVRPDPEAFIESLDPLQPRVYSISSSPSANPGRVSLTVDAVRYEVNGRARLGVCSTFLADRVAVGSKLRVYVQKAAHFALPEDASKPVIMIGPGTGVAPFRAFVQERRAIEAKGKNWLFFGDRQYTHDFLYQLDWQEYQKDGYLHRIDLAFSRDTPEKVYVQNKIWEKRKDVVAWLDGGAKFYVCGDAKNMAKDVRAALVKSFADVKALSGDKAEGVVRALESEKRYLTDVY
jgi:sulfite reductase (NADPH) flavoprotein alpha-component